MPHSQPGHRQQAQGTHVDAVCCETVAGGAREGAGLDAPWRKEAQQAMLGMRVLYPRALPL